MPGDTIELNGRYTIGGNADAVTKKVEKNVSRTVDKAEKLETILRRAAVSVNKSQARATEVMGVYGRGGTESYSKYKPKGFAGDPIPQKTIDKIVSTSNAVHGVYGKGGTTPYSGYVPKGFAGDPQPTIQYDRAIGPVQQKQLSRTEKFNNTLKKLTKHTFMAQMGMLGVAFSTQALISSFRGMLMGGISGLADTQGSMQKFAYADAFGGQSILSGLDMGKFITASLNAKGALEALNSVMTLLFTEVFSNTPLVDKTKEALTILIDRLTSPEFVNAIIRIIDAIADEKFINSLIDAALAIANLVGQLGEAGLLDKILLLVVACQLLMPLFATLQLIFIAIGTVAGVQLLLVLAAIGVTIYTIVDAFKDFEKSGNLVVDILNVVMSLWLSLFRLLAMIPSTLFDLFSTLISTLSSGLIQLQNPFKMFENFLLGYKDQANTTFGNSNPAYKYDTGTHQYNTVVNINKPVGTLDADAMKKLAKDITNGMVG